MNERSPFYKTQLLKSQHFHSNVTLHPVGEMHYLERHQKVELKNKQKNACIQTCVVTVAFFVFFLSDGFHMV